MIVSSFIIQANVIPIVNYDRQTFIVQATEVIEGAVFTTLYFLRNIRMGKIS